MMGSRLLAGSALNPTERVSRGEHFTRDGLSFSLYNASNIRVSFLRPQGAPTAGGSLIAVHGAGFLADAPDAGASCSFVGVGNSGNGDSGSGDSGSGDRGSGDRGSGGSGSGDSGGIGGSGDSDTGSGDSGSGGSGSGGGGGGGGRLFPNDKRNIRSKRSGRQQGSGSSSSKDGKAGTAPSKGNKQAGFFEFNPPKDEAVIPGEGRSLSIYGEAWECFDHTKVLGSVTSIDIKYVAIGKIVLAHPGVSPARQSLSLPHPPS